MNNEKHLSILTKVSIGLLALSLLLAVFKVGPATEPIYTYISNSKVSTLISVSSMCISFVLAFILILLFLNNKVTSFYQMGIFLLLISLSMDITIGGDIIFSVISAINIIVFAFNLKASKKGKLIK